MDKPTAIQEVNDACKRIARELIRIDAAAPDLGSEPTQDEIYKTLFELTKRVETIKKRVGQLQKESRARKS